MRQLIYNHLRGTKVLVLFILTNLVYAWMLLVTIPQVMQYADGIKLLDMMPAGYDAVYVQKLFDGLGIEGRHAYLYKQIPVDMIYPLLFGISYCLLLAYFLNKLGKLNSVLFYLCLLPLLAGLADYMENTGIITMLNHFPDIADSLITFTCISTLVKSAASTLYFVTLIIVLIWLGIQTLTANRTKKHI